MSLVDAPSSPPRPLPGSSPEPVVVGGAAAADDPHQIIETSVPVASTAKTLTPAPNGKTPTPLPVRQRVEQQPVAEPSQLMAPPAASSTPSTPAESEAARLTANPEPVPAAVDTGSAGAGEEVVDSPADALGSMSELNEALPTATTTTEGVVGGDAVEAAPPLPAAAAAGGEPAEGEDGDAESVGEEASTNSLKDDPGTPEECNLFVGDLARNLTEEKLEKAFEQHGRVMSVSIKRDRATGKNLGYGFVKLSSHQEARAAKEAMQGVELGGRRVRVGWAQKNTSLYVGGLEGGAITTEMLVREFARFGPLDKELTTIKPGAKFGFVKYRYRLHAEAAKKELNERPAFDGLCPSLEIEWNSVESSAQASETAGSEKSTAEERTTGGGGGGGGKEGGTGGRARGSSQHAGGGVGAHSRHPRGEVSSHTVHVQFEGDQGHVSAVNEVMIRKCFTKWEPVVDIVIPASRFNGASPGPRQLPRCWAFVHFPPTPDGERAAADAIKGLNGTTISELRVHCTMSRGGGTRAGSPWRKQGGGGGGGNRSRRHSTGGGGGDRAMSHAGGGQGFGGRPSRSSLDGPGATQGRSGGWGGHAGMHRHNMQQMHQQHQQGRHLAPGGAGGHHHPGAFPPHMQHPHPHPHMQPHHLHPHPHAGGGPLQHQQ
ncbi:unnamed protein product, partial [Ectocarpus sp. 8 AP-2014]